MAEAKINGKTYDIKTPLARSKQSGNRSSAVQVAGVGQRGAKDHSSEGVYISGDYYRNDITGKPYPGRVNFNTQRVLAYNSTVVRAIVTLRAHQVAKLPPVIIPSNSHEPPRKVNILDYGVYEIDEHPAFSSDEKSFLTKIYNRIDPRGIKDKKYEYEMDDEEFTLGEKATIEYLQKKHESFYRKRAEDIERIQKLIHRPDPWFTITKSWSQLLKSILNDILVIDRGTILKLRNESGELKGLMPIDGASVRPLIDEYGAVDDERAYVQVINGSPQVFLSKDDVIVMQMNPMTDLKYFGYGLSAMETLYTTVLSDIFIDKGNLDYYRKGGSIPEGFISIEPPASRDGMTQQIDQEQLESIQRHLQSIMMGDYTQVPVVSGGKISWIDFKGKRRDMQYKELAEHLTRKICAVFQVSPQDVGIISDVNRSTSQTQAEMTKSKGLETLMSTISEYFTEEVINEIRPERDLRLWFEDDDLDKQKMEWNMAQQKLVSGALSINQWRATQGQHPVPWGNTPLQGLNNWKPADEKEEEMQQGGILGDLPPIGGPGNPGGPVGGDNPMAGQPAQPNADSAAMTSPATVKSNNFFALNKVAEEKAEDMMIKSFADMYMDSAKFDSLVKLQDIHNYPGGEWMRAPMESYEYFVNSHPELNVTLTKSVSEVNDPLVFASYEGNGIVNVSEEGSMPIVKSLTQAAVDGLSDEVKEKAVEFLGDESYLEEAMERSIYKSLDPALQEVLYQDFYKFHSFELSDAQVEEFSELI